MYAMEGGGGDFLSANADEKVVVKSEILKKKYFSHENQPLNDVIMVVHRPVYPSRSP